VSTFRAPPGDKAPQSRFGSDLESQLRTSSGNSDDIPPVSSRFDKFASSGPLSTRSLGTIVSTTAPARSPQTGSYTAAAPLGRNTKGGIYHLTKLLERKHGAFFISRVILASGINLRGYDLDSADDPTIALKFIKTLRNMLSPTDMAEILTQAPSVFNNK